MQKTLQKNLFLCICLLLLLGTSAYSQNITGTVKDAKGDVSQVVLSVIVKGIQKGATQSGYLCKIVA